MVQVVPLVWNHQHDDPLNVLGHALLENREDGVYAYCLLNDTLQGKNTKALVEHGDIGYMSIYANHLQHNGNSVVHGQIREVSLVLAGANPGACIESVISHSEDGYVDDEEGVIYSGEELSLEHSDEEEEEEKPEEDKTKEPEPTPEPEKTPEPTDEVEHSDDTSEETVGDVIKTLNKKQMAVVEALVTMALKEKEVKETEPLVINADRTMAVYGNYRFNFKYLRVLPKEQTGDESESRVILDADKINIPFIIRFRQPGDQFVPFGMTQLKRLKEFFIDEKVPKYERDLIPVFDDGEKLFWIVGYRLDNRVRYDESTTRYLQITATNISVKSRKAILKKKRGNNESDEL